MRNFIAFLMFFFVIISCSSSKQILTNSDKIENKKIIFIFERNNDFIPLEKKGDHIGNSKTPTNSRVFEKTIIDIANETNLDLIYQEQYVFPSDSVIPIIVSIDKIEWEWSTFSAVMNTSLIYKSPLDTIKITGSNRNYLFGTKKRNLYQSMKNGNYLFLTFMQNKQSNYSISEE